MQTTILYILTAYNVVLLLSGFLRLLAIECSLYCYWTPLDQDLLISHVYISTSMSKKSSVDCGSPSSRDSLMAKNHCSCMCCGDVEENPGPPAAAVNKPDKMQLTMIHVNAHSLLCHLEDVPALLLTKHLHILALLET